jgi:putative nucleotidyltransferase with HDIG domain
MLSPPHLSNRAQAYVWAVIFAGFCVVVSSVYELTAHPVGYQWFLLAALTLISGSATVRLPSIPASISISETFVFAAVLLYGPAAGTLTVALDGLVISYWIAKRRQEPYRALFNMSAPALSAWCSSQLFFLLAGIRPLVIAPAPLNQILPALLVFAIAYFSFNSWLIAWAIGLEKHLPAYPVWREHFLWLSLNYFCGASVAVLLVAESRQLDLRFIGVIVPLLLVLYFTFKLSMDRVEDAHQHVDKVNKLYLSTIETLAMAIDAKDQVTHGHIRRVQQYAVGLARELGVKDEALLKAIEAAALLHDMGKLAVPEYILNKPGRLTEAEFEKMKLHASVGAEILSAIDFPYPVVPIVRHHHESWDGSGYPDGLRGTEIPIGARILSVVDCFDALTSDRPYRRQLSDGEALEILNERRGTMYDPWVVQTFERVHATLDAAIVNDSRVAKKETRANPRSTGAAGPVSAPKSAPELPESGQTIGSSSGEHESLLLQLSRITNASMGILFRYDRTDDELVAARFVGSVDPILAGMKMSLGEQLSGWVAANKQPIINSDAALDLGSYAVQHQPKLSFCLSIPLAVGGTLTGVISLYSAAAFRPEDETSSLRIARDFTQRFERPPMEAAQPLALRAVR